MSKPIKRLSLLFGGIWSEGDRFEVHLNEERKICYLLEAMANIIVSRKVGGRQAGRQALYDFVGVIVTTGTMYFSALYFLLKVENGLAVGAACITSSQN